MNRITLLDGAVGTSLWGKAEKSGIAKVPVWTYNMEHPEMVAELTHEYVSAGAKMILTNTFGANRLSVSRSGYDTADVVRTGVRLTKAALAGTGCKTVLAVGPLPELLEPYGDLGADEAREIFEEQIGAGMDENPDAVMIQTFMDLEMMRIAASVAARYSVPLYCTMTFGPAAKTMMGNSVEDVIRVLSAFDLSGIGLNCSIGPDAAVSVLREFRRFTDLPLVFKPNAGKPFRRIDGTTGYNCSPEEFAATCVPVLDIVSFIGGCCGSDPSYIRVLKTLL